MSVRAFLMIAAAGCSLAYVVSKTQSPRKEREPDDIETTASAIAEPEAKPRAPAAESKTLVNKTQSPSLKEWQEKIDHLVSCEETHACAFPETDSRSYSFAVGQALASALTDLRTSLPASKSNDAQITELCSEMLLHPDGYVKEAALALLATQPPSDKALQAILDGIIDQYDPTLVAPALSQLKRYTRNGDLNKIDETFQKAMLTGAPFLAQELSKEIGPFINKRNSKSYFDFLELLPEKSIVRKNLGDAVSQASL